MRALSVADVELLRELVLDDLIPLMIQLNGDASEWTCHICRVSTPLVDARAKLSARHASSCRIGKVVLLLRADIG